MSPKRRKPDYLNELIAKREKTSPGFAKKVDEAYRRRVAARKAGSKKARAVSPIGTTLEASHRRDMRADPAYRREFERLSAMDKKPKTKRRR